MSKVLLKARDSPSCRVFDGWNRDAKSLCCPACPARERCRLTYKNVLALAANA
jgi:hypothetical protein